MQKACIRPKRGFFVSIVYTENGPINIKRDCYTQAFVGTWSWLHRPTVVIWVSYNGRMTLCKHTRLHTHIHTYIYIPTYIHTQVLVGWQRKERFPLPSRLATLSCQDSQNTRRIVTNGSANPSTQNHKASRFVCVFMLMGLVALKAHTYLCLYIS